ncbi:hypothetical protein V2J09_011664 [Rumex salicifolius]
MFTPQKKGTWTPIPPSPAPRTEAKGSALVAGRLSSAAKGKAVAFVDGSSAPPPPPLSFLEGNGGGMGHDSGNMEDWRRFKEVGLLDAAALERRDHEALVQTVSRLEKELHDYQYNMGLLLIEKNDLATNCEDLRHEVAEAREIFKREQSAHLIAMSEAEKREENLKRTLDLEKSCVVDLERAVHEMSDELEQAKATAKTGNTKAHIAQLRDERVEVESKLHLANIRAAEADRKIKELDMKLQELQARESTLTAQRHTLDTEQGTYETNHKKQKEDFKKWEKKLQEREERLHEQRRMLEEREDKIHESERKLKQKEIDVDQLLKTTDGDNCNLKQREEDVSKRLNELASKEKEAELLRVNLEKREQQLRALEERLSDKERVEIQKLIDEHRAILETKSEELELEMQQKRNSLDEEFKKKLHAIEKKEVEVNHQEAKLAKMEQAVREKSERFKEKEKKIEERSKALKKEESSLKKLENKLDSDRKDLSADKENMQLLNGEIEKLKDELRKKELLIQEENEKLKCNMETRSEHIRLMSSLNQEMEKWRHENELLTKEKEDLSQERMRVEKDWEALDEKRATVDSELKKFNEEKGKFERFRYMEEEKFKKEKIEMDGRVERELESIRLEKESFAAKMKHEQLTLAENARNEHEQIVQEFEQRRRELENRVQKQEEEMEKELKEKRLSFEDKRSIDMRNINNMKELAEKQKEEMESGWLKVKKAREAIAFDKQKLEEDQREIHKDINSLGILSKKLKDQREQLLHERARFLSFIERLNVCQTCGDFTSQFVISDLQLPSAPQSMDHIAVKTSPEAGDFDLSESDGQKSWLKKCASKIFKISSIKRMQDDTDQCQVGTPTSASQPPSIDEDESKLQLQSSHVNRQDHPSASTSNAFDTQDMQLNGCNNKASTEDPSFVDAPTDSKEPAVPEESEQSSMQGGRRRARRKVSTTARKRSSKTAVVNAKNNQREASTLQEEDEDEEPSYSNLSNVEGEKATGTSARKRTRATSSRRKGTQHDDDEYSDGPADSMPVGGRKKRRETEPVALPTPCEKRYNLRRNKASAGATTAVEASNPNASDDKAARNHGKSAKKSVLNTEQDSAFVQNANSEHQGTVSTPKSIELSSERAVRFKMPEDDAKDNVEVTKPVENKLSEEPNSIDNRLLSEEAHNTEENADEDDNETVFFEDEDGTDDDDDGDDPGDVSMGRLLWKFFTT